MTDSPLTSILKEERVFAPPAAFAEQAHVPSLAAYQALYAEAEQDPEAFWARQARERLHWFKPFQQTLQWEAPFAQWFVGGTTNVAYNCLDRHLTTWQWDAEKTCKPNRPRK